MISQRKQNLVKIDPYRSLIIDSGNVANQIMKILGEEKVQNNMWVTSRYRRMEIKENSYYMSLPKKKKLYYMIFSGFAGIIRGSERKLRNVWLPGKIGEDSFSCATIDRRGYNQRLLFSSKIKQQ